MPINPSIPLGATMAQIASPLEIAQLLQQNRRQQDAAEALAEDRRAQAAVRQATLGEIATRQQAQAETTQQNKTLDQLMQGALTPDPVTGVAKFDIGKISQGMVDAGQGHRLGALQPTLDALHQSSEAQAAEARKSIAYAIRGVQLAGNSPEAAQAGLAYLVKNRALDATAAQPVLEAIQGDPTAEAIDRLLTGFGGRLPEYQALVQAEATKKTATEKAAAELAETKAKTAKLESEATNGPAKHLQSETMLVNGRPAPTVFDPATGRYSLGGVDVTDKVQPVPPRPRVGEAGAGLTADRRQALVQAVIDNPDLYDKLTPTVIGELAPDLAVQGFGFGRRLSDAAVAKMSDARSAIASVRDLRTVLQENEKYIGPVAGLQALNPYSDARKAQANIDLVRQRVGKVLEGGVLRKEDEEKYKKILATLTDTPSTAVYKTDQLIEQLESDLKIFADEQRAAGRRTAPYTPTGAQPGAPAAQPGPTRPAITIKGAVPGDATATPDYGYGNRYGTNTPKGLGFLGPLQRVDGGVMSEFSIGVNLDGKETEIPTLVPTLTKGEVQTILSLPEGQKLPPAIADKAVAYARDRIKAGKDPFAGPGEQQNLYPELKRAPVPSVRGAAPSAGGPLTVGGFTVKVK